MNSTEPFQDCPNCDRDGFNVINGNLTICNVCGGSGTIVVN